MRLFKRRTDDTSIRTVTLDDGESVIGHVGRVGDLIDAGMLGHGEDRKKWAYIPRIGDSITYAATREKALEDIE